MNSKALYVMPLCLLLGCASLTQKQATQARQSRKEAAQTVRTFAEALADDQVTTAMEQVSTALPPEEREHLSMAVRRASWLAFYTGYSLDVETAVNNRDLDTWLEHEVELSAPASNAQGRTFTEWMKLQKTPDGWKLADIQLRSPARGADVDLPSDDRDKVAKRVTDIMTKLQKGKYAELALSLPKATQYRKRRESWWSWLLGANPRVRHVYNDLRRLKKVDVHRWPNPATFLPCAYVSTNSVMVIYTLPYSAPELGISDDELRIEILMSQAEDEWKTASLRLYGKAIPDVGAIPSSSGQRIPQ